MTPDNVFVFLQNIDVLWLLTALAGGAFAAMIGANWAFAFTGVAIFLGLGVAAGTGSTIVLDYVAFGPVFGPHISFAGGAAAAAYAARARVLKAGGKDINTSLVGLGRQDVILVGALFGGGAYVVQRLLSQIPWFGGHTDSVALTVVLSGVAARLLFGSTPLAHRPVKPTDAAGWLRYQETPGQLLSVAGFSSLFAAGMAVVFANYVVPLGLTVEQYPQLVNSAKVLPFAISAICIFFVASGHRFPVTHHMTITAGMAAVEFFAVTHNGIAAILIGTVFGVVAGFVGELAARVFYNQGDTHVDPPAIAIFIMNTAIWVALIPLQQAAPPMVGP